MFQVYTMVLVWLVKDYGKPLKGLLVSPGLETVRYRAKPETLDERL